MEAVPLNSIFKSLHSPHDDKESELGPGPSPGSKMEEPQHVSTDNTPNNTIGMRIKSDIN